MGIISSLGFGKKTLYFPGCLTKEILKEELQNYKDIFNILKIDFVMLPDLEVCCGLPVLNAGYRKDLRKLALKNYNVFKKNKIKKIITSCPSCYHTFSHIYPSLIKEWDIEVEHATVSIYNALKRRGYKFRGEREKVSYHDPCHLGRYSGIYEEPRKVIEMLGGEIVEYKYNRDKSFCCGGGGGLRANYPEIAKGIANFKSLYLNKESKKIISPCGLCYLNIKSASDKSVEFSTFVLSKLKEGGK